MSDKSEEYYIPVMDTGLDHQVSTPELNDNNFNSSVMLPRGNTYSRGKFIGKKIDASGNAFGRSNENPILTHANIVLGLMMGRSAN